MKHVTGPLLGQMRAALLFKNWRKFVISSQLIKPIFHDYSDTSPFVSKNLILLLETCFANKGGGGGVTDTGQETNYSPSDQSESEPVIAGL